MASASRSDSVPPEVEHEKRRQLRQDYRNLFERTQKNRQELISPQSDGLVATLTEAEELFAHVKKSKCPREAALDSNLIRLVSSLGNERANKLHTDFLTFEPTEFADKLVSFMSDRRIRNEDTEQRNAPFPKEGWSKLGQVAKSCLRQTPSFHFMLGSFERGEPAAKIKKSCNPRQKEKDAGQLVVPKQVQSMGKSHHEVTTEEVEKMLGILHQVTNFNQESDQSEVEPVSLFEFIINPHSFSQTVENIFHLSFLVKDGHAQVALDEDNLPIIIPTDPYMEGQTNERVNRKQVMVSLDMPQWKEIVEIFEITEPLIPTRQEESGSEMNGLTKPGDRGLISNGVPH